jgi:PmbA protein
MNKRPEPTVADLEQIVADVLREASAVGASQAEASASFGAGLSVTVRMRDVETLEYHRDQGLAVTVYHGQRRGSASTSDFGPEALLETVRKASALARYAADDPASGLADPARLATDFPDLDLDHPWPIDPAAAIDLATECEAAALDRDPRVSNSEGASVGTHRGCRVYGNSHGFLHGYRSSQHSISCAVLASQDGKMERDFEYTVARAPAELMSAAVIGREAADRAVSRLGARKLKTAEVPVLFPARLARSLFGHLLGAISGGSQYRKASFLVDRLDTAVLSELVTIRELPHLRRGLASAAYDDEGVATTDRVLVDAGVLRGYMLGSYYARKLGLETTGNAGGAHNLVVSDTGQGFDELLAATDRGLLVTELMGQGVNLVTGDYSRGAAGFWIEGGEIRYPVSEITIAGNLADMYGAIAGIGTDTDVRGGIRTGSVLVSRMTVAGS